MRVSEYLRPVSIYGALKNKNREKSSSTEAEEVVVSDILNNSDETLGAECPTEDLSFKEIATESYQSVKPLLALLRSHECKVLYKYEFNPTSGISWYVTLKEKSNALVLVQRLALVGASIILEGDEFGVLQVSLFDEMWNAGRRRSTQDGLDFENSQLSLDCGDADTNNRLQKLCLLSIFECLSIFKTITGSIISTVGVRMPDMHLVLSSAFNFKDWCEVYLENQGWVKLFCHIRRARKSLKGKPDDRCHIKFYKDDKCNKLVCFIPDTEYIQDVFFCPEKEDKSPAHFEDDTASLLDSLTTIKILGNVCFTSASQSRSLLRSRSSIIPNLKKSSSLVSLISTSRKRATTDSFAINGQTDNTPLESSSQNNNQTGDSTPIAESIRSGTSGISSSPKFTTLSEGLLIRPLVHGGIGHLESMIRFIVPIMDCTRKYGRPGKFNKDRYDPHCLMYGLPRLPSIDYFAKEEIEKILTEPLSEDSGPSENTAFAMSYFGSLLNDCIQKNPQRVSKLHFQMLTPILTTGSSKKHLQIPQATVGTEPLSVYSNSASLLQ